MTPYIFLLHFLWKEKNLNFLSRGELTFTVQTYFIIDSTCPFLIVTSNQSHRHTAHSRRINCSHCQRQARWHHCRIISLWILLTWINIFTTLITNPIRGLGWWKWPGKNMHKMFLGLKTVWNLISFLLIEINQEDLLFTLMEVTPSYWNKGRDIFGY